MVLYVLKHFFTLFKKTRPTPLHTHLHKQSMSHLAETNTNRIKYIVTYNFHNTHMYPKSLTVYTSLHALLHSPLQPFLEYTFSHHTPWLNLQLKYPTTVRTLPRSYYILLHIHNTHSTSHTFILISS